MHLGGVKTFAYDIIAAQTYREQKRTIMIEESINDTEAKRVLVVGGSPEPASAREIRAAAILSDAVVAVDRGLDAVLACGLSPDLFCGDADTVSAAGARLVARCEEQAAFGVEPDFDVVRYDPHKDLTDLALALSEVALRWPGARIVATCLAGGAPDHALAVLGRLAAYPGEVGFIEDGYCGRVLKAGERWEMVGERGGRFSFTALSTGAAASLSGMRWNLDGHPVELLSDLGISNVVEGDEASVSCISGVLICWLFSAHR